MSPELLVLAKGYFLRGEGQIPYAYRCIHGLATFGIGHMAASPIEFAKAPWQRKNGTYPGRQEIYDEYQRIMALPYGVQYAATFYEPHTRLRLSQQTIDNLFELDLGEAERILADRFKRYDYWPLQAQLAMIDMMFSIGPAFLGKLPPKAYPKLVAAADRGDWDTCAAECERRGVSPSRNAALKALFESAVPQKMIRNNAHFVG